MSIAQCAVTSFKVELFQAVHNFGPTGADTFKFALYTAAASLDASTTEYAASNEVVGTGYTAGGNELTISQDPTAGNNTYGVPTAYVSFENTSWPAAAFTARAGLIYNSTQGDKAVAVIDFGSDKTVSGTEFTVQFPTADANSAIVRIA